MKCFSQPLTFDLSEVENHNKARHILKNKCTLIQSLGVVRSGEQTLSLVVSEAVSSLPGPISAVFTGYLSVAQTANHLPSAR